MFNFYKKFETNGALNDQLAYESMVQVDGELISFGLKDNDYLSIHYPKSYSQIDLKDIQTIKPGSFVQISVNWNVDGLPTEKFWVEITDVIKIKGMPAYYGKVGNDTFLAPLDSKIGPIYPSCINRVYSKEYEENIVLPRLRQLA